MKAKVLMYGSGGNKVVRKYVELKETDTDNVYTHNEEGYDHLVYKYESNNVVFVEVCTIYGYESEDRKKQFKENYSLRVFFFVFFVAIIFINEACIMFKLNYF